MSLKKFTQRVCVTAAGKCSTTAASDDALAVLQCADAADVSMSTLKGCALCVGIIARLKDPSGCLCKDDYYAGSSKSCAALSFMIRVLQMLPFSIALKVSVLR